MPKKTSRKPANARDEKDEDEDDEEEEEEAGLLRDYVMARVGAALASAKAAQEACSEILAAFVNPDDDDDGSDREEMLEDALEAAGAASRALEDAQKVIKVGVADMDGMWEMGEPWEDE